MTLYPLMGIRRKARIKEIILAWKSYNPNGRSIRFKRGPYKKRDVSKVLRKSSEVLEEAKSDASKVSS